MDKDGGTALHGCACNGHVEVARCLLAAGADKDLADNDGRSPLHGAVWYGHVEVARCLLEAGADKDKTDHHGDSPVHVAARFLVVSHIGLLELVL